MAVLHNVILDEAIHGVHRVGNGLAALQFGHKAAVHQRGERAARAGEGVDIHGGIAVHHALQQAVRVQRRGDGDHVFRVLVGEGIIRLVDRIDVVAVGDAHALRGQLVKRHVAADHRIVAGEHVQIAVNHAVAVGIRQRHVAEFLRLAEAVLADVHAPDAASEHVIHLAARLVIRQAGGRFIAVRRERAQLGRLLVFNVVQPERRAGRFGRIIDDGHQQLALGIRRDVLHVAIHIDRQRLHAVGERVEHAAKGAGVAQVAGVGVAFVAIRLDDAERVAQIDDLAQRQRAVIRNQQLDELVGRIAVLIADGRHAVELAADGIEVAVQIGILAVVQLQRAGGLAVPGQHVLQLVIAVHRGQLAAGVVPRIERIPAGQQQLVAVDLTQFCDHDGQLKSFMPCTAMVTLPSASAAAPSIRASARRIESIFFIFGVLSLFTSYSFSQPCIALPPASLLEGGVERSETEGVRYSTYTITVMPMRTVSSGVKST